MKLSDFLTDIGRPVAFYPGLVKALGDRNEAIFICQMAYWRGKGDNKEGWIYKTSDQIEEETSLTYKEQTNVRAGLLKKGLLEEHYARTEHQMYYRVNWDAVNQIWEQFTNGQVPAGKEPPSPKSSGSLPAGGSLKGITEITTENTQRGKKFSNPLWDLQHGKQPDLADEDREREELEETYKRIAAQLETGLRRGEFPQSVKAQAVYRWIIKKESNGQKLERFIQWAMRDEKAASLTWVYHKDIENIKRDWPQAFPAASINPDEKRPTSYYA
jgi:hypothetical protein